MRRYEQVHRDGARDGYVDTRDAARRYDLGGRALARHLAGLGWRPYLPGLWVPGGREPSFEAQARMSLAYVGEPVLLTGAAALHALGVLTAPPRDVELVVPASRWLQPRDGLCVHYTSTFATVQTVSWKGCRLARAARAVADHSAHAGVTALSRVIADATRLRHCTVSQVGAELAVRKRFAGRGRLARAHGELVGELNHSRYERLGRQLLRDGGLDVPTRPGPVIHDNRPIAEIDIPFLDLRYGVEVDGPPHLLPEQAARDRARDRMLGSTCGLTIDRYLWFELEGEPDRFVREVTRRVRELSAGRSAALGRPPIPATGG